MRGRYKLLFCPFEIVRGNKKLVRFMDYYFSAYIIFPRENTEIIKTYKQFLREYIKSVSNPFPKPVFKNSQVHLKVLLECRNKFPGAIENNNDKKIIDLRKYKLFRFPGLHMGYLDWDWTVVIEQDINEIRYVIVNQLQLS